MTIKYWLFVVLPIFNLRRSVHINTGFYIIVRLNFQLQTFYKVTSEAAVLRTF